jgi:hypothetical protein
MTDATNASVPWSGLPEAIKPARPSISVYAGSDARKSASLKANAARTVLAGAAELSGKWEPAVYVPKHPKTPNFIEFYKKVSREASGDDDG